jgi:hypothetical protein
MRGKYVCGQHALEYKGKTRQKKMMGLCLPQTCPTRAQQEASARMHPQPTRKERYLSLHVQTSKYIVPGCQLAQPVIWLIIHQISAH